MPGPVLDFLFRSLHVWSVQAILNWPNVVIDHVGHLVRIVHHNLVSLLVA